MKPKFANLLLLTSVVVNLCNLASAADITKADNTDNLNLGTSWSLGAAPGANDIAVWNNTIAGTNSAALGGNVSWGGIKLTNPGGAVTITTGSTLTLGKGGIDMSTAQQNLTINAGVALAASTVNPWSVATGRTLTLGGTFARSSGQTLKITNTGTINIAGGTASSVLGYGVLNGTDFAALDASKNITAAASVITYIANPVGTSNNASLSGGSSATWLDVTTSNPAAAPSAFRLSNSYTLGGLRFNQANSNNIDWVVDANSRNFTLGAILVTANVGAHNVLMNDSTGNVWRLGAGSEAIMHQYNTSGDLIFNGKITQSAGTGSIVTKDGPGRVILTNDSNGWAGATNINEGTLQIGNGSTTGAINASSAVNLSGNLQFNKTNTVSFTNLVTGTGTVTQAGAGTLTMNNASNSYSGGTVLKSGTTTYNNGLGDFGSGSFTFSGGTLQMKSGAAVDISTRTVTLAVDGGTIDTNGNDISFANSIGGGGTGGLTKTGGGKLTLNGTSYTGTTVVSGGSLVINGSIAGGATVASGSTLGGTGSYAGTITANNGGTIAPGNSVGTITTAGLTLASGSILNFEFNNTPANDYISVTTSNGLTINGGGFNLYAEGTTNAFSAPGTYNLIGYSGTIGGAGTSALAVLNPQAGKNYLFGSTASDVTVAISASGVISDWNVDADGSWNTLGNWTGVVPNGVGETANFSKTLTASRTVVLDGGKILGGISFNGGASPLGYTIAAGTGGSLSLNNGASQGNIIVTTGANTISADVSLDSATVVAAVGAGSSLAISGAVSGTGALVKSGVGTLDLTNTGNTYGGGTTVSAGTLGFAALGSLGNGNISLDGGTLRYDSGNTSDISSKTVTITSNGGVINTNGNDVTLANSIGNGGTGSLTKTGAGTLALQGANTQTGATTVTGGTLSISSNSNLGDAATGAGLTLNGGTLRNTATTALDNSGANNRAVAIGAGGGSFNTDLDTTLTISGSVSGSGALAKLGAGTLELTANNSAGFSGAVNIGAGSLKLGGGLANAQLALGTGTVTFTGGTLQLNSGGGSSSYSGNLSNNLVVASGQTGTLAMFKNGSATGSLTGGGTLNVQVDGTRDEFQGNWGAFTGGINLTGAGEFRIGNFQNQVFNNSKLDIGTGVTVRQVFNPPTGSGTETVQNIGQLSGASGSTLAGNPVGGRFVNWTVGGLGTSSTFSGSIIDDAGAAKLTKVGNGTLTLDGTSTYSGATTVTAGTLLVNGALGNTTTSVSSGAKLGGTGAIGGGVTVSAGGFISPGASIESLDVGSATINGTLITEYDGTGAGTIDLLGVSGSLDITNATLDFNQLGASLDDSFYVFATYGSLTGTQFANVLDLPSGYDINYAFDNGLTTSNIALVAVPEPASLLLGSLGLLAILRRRRN